MSLSNVKGASEDSLSSYIYNYKDNVNGQVNNIIGPIKNMTYVFAVPTELVYSDHLSWNIDNASYYGYESYGTLISASIIAIILLIALIFPYKKVKDFSVITFKHKVGDKDMGTIGIIGPKRMDYSKVISVMKYINKKLKDKGI